MNGRLKKSLDFGLAGNVLFVLFGMICYVFYLTYKYKSPLSITLEVIAYFIELLGFGLLIFSSYLMWTTIRMRKVMKIGYTVYIVLEALMMFLELHSYKFSFYEPYSLALAIIHAVISASVCFTFLQLDPDRNKFEVVVILSIGIILGGMLGNIMGVRVYFSIAANAVGFCVLFAGIRYLIRREEMEIDCHGDNGRKTEYSSQTMFEDKKD